MPTSLDTWCVVWRETPKRNAKTRYKIHPRLLQYEMRSGASMLGLPATEALATVSSTPPTMIAVPAHMAAVTVFPSKNLPKMTLVTN
jgi:hypothetical protein